MFPKKFQKVANPASTGPTASKIARRAKDYDMFALPTSEVRVDFYADEGADGFGGEYVGTVLLKGDTVTFAKFYGVKPFSAKILKPANATRAIAEVASALNAGYDNNAATVEEFAKGILQIV